LNITAQQNFREKLQKLNISDIATPSDIFITVLIRKGLDQDEVSKETRKKCGVL